MAAGCFFTIRRLRRSDSLFISRYKGRQTAEGVYMTEQTSSLSEVAPMCPKCRSPLVLKRLLSGRMHYKGKFECDSCGRSVTRTVELESTQSPPLASTSPAEET